MKNFFRNHYGFIAGFASGAGCVLFGIEAFKSSKNPLLYIRGFGLMIGGRIVYSALKRNDANLLNPAKGSEAK